MKEIISNDSCEKPWVDAHKERYAEQGGKDMPQPTYSQVREEYRRRGLARVRERDKALGFILGMVSFLFLSVIIFYMFVVY